MLRFGERSIHHYRYSFGLLHQRAKKEAKKKDVESNGGKGCFSCWVCRVKRYFPVKDREYCRGRRRSVEEHWTFVSPGQPLFTNPAQSSSPPIIIIGILNLLDNCLVNHPSSPISSFFYLQPHSTHSQQTSLFNTKIYLQAMSITTIRNG